MLLSTIRTLVLLGTLALLPCAGARAAEMRFDVQDMSRIRVGDVFVVNILLDSDEGINAVEGGIRFSPEMLSVREIRDGNSMVNFWVEHPRLVSEGNVAFSGITPGGFVGVNAKVLSVAFEAQRDGPVSLALVGAKALKSDGFGTSAPLKLHPVDFSVSASDGSMPRAFSVDVDVPEDFVPLVVEASASSAHEAFVAFSTQDKGSGIDFYEIKETRIPSLPFLARWKKAESPYVLSDQKLKSHLFVRATDFQGNERLVEVAPKQGIAPYEYLPYWFIMMGTTYLLYRTVKLWKKQ